jgi:Protein of unknown function (DUF5672)
MSIESTKVVRNSNGVKTVAIVLPIYKERLTADEEISLRHLRHFLAGYETYCVAPKGLVVNYHQYQTIYFDPKYFTSLNAYSTLLLTKEFYQAFSDYEFILLYQLDALVFSDQLLQWCEKGYDYIGAPSFHGHGQGPEKLAVGNGGFSLRRVSACLKILQDWEKGGRTLLSRAREIAPIYIMPWRYGNLKQWILAVYWYYRRLFTYKRVLIEDYFWSFEAKRYNPGFNIAPVEEAFKFSFENNPRYCYEHNHRQLPFGCHAWTLYDRGFWEPFLLK